MPWWWSPCRAPTESLARRWSSSPICSRVAFRDHSSYHERFAGGAALSHRHRAAPRTGLHKPSQIMVDKPQTIPREKVGEVIGSVNAETMLAVSRSLTVFLGIA